MQGGVNFESADALQTNRGENGRMPLRGVVAQGNMNMVLGMHIVWNGCTANPQEVESGYTGGSPSWDYPS